MTERPPKIQEAIEALYHVFSRYRFTDMVGDAVFPGFCDPKPLLAHQLRVLPIEAFDTFAWKTMTTWGTADDFRHFLPRMLELLYTEIDRFGHITGMMERDPLFGKLTYGKWQTWPAREVAAIKDFVSSWWSEIIHREISGDDLKRQLQAGESITYLFEQWHAPDLARFFLDDVDRLECPSLRQDLLSQWEAEIEAGLSEAPVANLATVYLNTDDIGREPSDAWFTHPDRVTALFAAWQKHAEEEPWSSFFSDAHSNAELVCANPGKNDRVS